MSEKTLRSTRASGDAIQELISENLEAVLGNRCKEYSPSFARRSMADIAFVDKQDFYCLVDVKTHREGMDFNMPNLTSVRRLSNLYEDDTNIFAVLIVRYELKKRAVKALEVNFAPIEFLDWSCLTIGALGWGQIQIADSNKLKINPVFSRKKWMIKLCDKLLYFYPEEISKIEEREREFEEVREKWKKRKDVWK